MRHKRSPAERRTRNARVADRRWATPAANAEGPPRNPHPPAKAVHQARPFTGRYPGGHEFPDLEISRTDTHLPDNLPYGVPVLAKEGSICSQGPPRGDPPQDDAPPAPPSLPGVERSATASVTALYPATPPLIKITCWTPRRRGSPPGARKPNAKIRLLALRSSGRRFSRCRQGVCDGPTKRESTLRASSHATREATGATGN